MPFFYLNVLHSEKQIVITVTLNGEGVENKGSGIVISEIDTLYHFHHDNDDDDDMTHRDDNDDEPNRKNNYVYNQYVTMDFFQNP